MTIKKESGENRKFGTGAEKQHSEGKGTPVLFPGDAYIEVCKHFEAGAQHYEARNWEQGIPLSELINSLERHIADEKMGKTDERHDRAIAWNAIAYLATKIRIQRGLLPADLDDMPRYEKIIENPSSVDRMLIQEKRSKLSEQCDATIECVSSRGWQIRLANGMFLGIMATPYYYATEQEAEKHLTAYLETLK